MSSTKKEGFSSNPKTNVARIDLDSILVEELGQFGKFQKRVILLAAIAVAFGAWGTNEYVFSSARIPTRCHIPECDLEEPEFTPVWLLNAVPGTSLDSFDSCQRFVNATAPAHSELFCPADWFHRDQVEKCERHVYYNKDTVVYTFDLGCDEWRRSLIGSVVVAGMMAAMPLTGFVSDRWGRRTALVVNAVNTAWIGLLRYFSTSYTTFIKLEFARNMFGAGTFSAAQIMAMEVAGPKYRATAAISCSTFFATSLVIMGLIAWAVPNWITFTFVMFIPQLLIISYMWLMPESIRWYLSKNRYADAERVLKRVAIVNNKQLSEKVLETLRGNVEEEQRNQTEIKIQNEEPWLIVTVFRHKRVLIRCILSPIWWFTSTFVYYGLLINAVNITGNKYLNYMAVAAAQIPGFWTALLLLDRIGRKPLICGGFLICAACQIAYIFMPKDLYALSLTVYLVGTSCSAAVISSIYVYTAELYPTKYRHRLFAFCSMIGRFGSLIAPLTPALGAAVLWDELPFALFAGCACAASVLVLFTPETRGVGFTDTMEEAENIGKNKT